MDCFQDSMEKYQKRWKMRKRLKNDGKGIMDEKSRK
jgi:hypothetical protein